MKLGVGTPKKKPYKKPKYYRGYSGLQKITRNYKNFNGISEDYKKITKDGKGISKDYKRRGL